MFKYNFWMGGGELFSLNQSDVFLVSFVDKTGIRRWFLADTKTRTECSSWFYLIPHCDLVYIARRKSHFIEPFFICPKHSGFLLLLGNLFYNERGINFFNFIHLFAFMFIKLPISGHFHKVLSCPGKILHHKRVLLCDGNIYCLGVQDDTASAAHILICCHLVLPGEKKPPELSSAWSCHVLPEGPSKSVHGNHSLRNSGIGSVRLNLSLSIKT